VPPSALKRAKRFVRFQLVRLAIWLVQRIPLRIAQRIGKGFGALAFRVAGGERRKMLASLGRAFPEQPPDAHARLARACFQHFGTMAFEMVCVAQLAPQLEAWVEWPPEDQAALRDALAEGKGVVFVTGHLGNWELLGWRMAKAAPFYAVGKASPDDRLGERVAKLRADGGIQSIWRGDPSAARKLLGALKQNAVLCLLIDQDTRVQNLFVPFFGELAATPRSAADLALRGGAPAMVGYILKKPDGRYRLRTYRLPLPASGDREADALALTAHFTRELEQAIRQAPEQWVWMHQRWKTRP
jgi:KDO2-lipid IV(A) lauroyltransferase